MTNEITPGKPTTRRYTKEEKDQAVRLVFEFRNELGTKQDEPYKPSAMRPS